MTFSIESVRSDILALRHTTYVRTFSRVMPYDVVNGYPKFGGTWLATELIRIVFALTGKTLSNSSANIIAKQPSFARAKASAEQIASKNTEMSFVRECAMGVGGSISRTRRWRRSARAGTWRRSVLWGMCSRGMETERQRRYARPRDGLDDAARKLALTREVLVAYFVEKGVLG